jgi:hypothetical protein
MKLSTYVSLPFLHTVDPEVRAVTDAMGPTNRAMLNDWQAYAKAQGIDITFQYEADLFSQAQKAMDKSQGDAVQAAGDDFGLKVLMLMYIDYQFGHSLIQTTLSQTNNLDAELRGLLQKDLQLHNEGIAAINGVLKRFKLKQGG